MKREVEYSRYCWKCKHNSKSEEDDPCYECLANPLNEDSAKPINFEEGESHPKMPFVDLVKLREFVFKAEYSVLDYGFAKQYYRSKEPSFAGSCSAFRKDNLICRSLDWTYDNGAEFIVKTKASGSRHAVIGIASGIKELTDEFVSGGQYSDIYKVLPMQLSDGINDAGLSASVLVVPTDKGTSPAEPTVQVKEELNSLMLIRYILDNFSTALEACEFVKKYVKVWFSRKLIDMGYVVHYFVADKADTYCLEFVNGATKYTKINGRPYITNFYLDGIYLNTDGTVFTPVTRTETADPVTTNHITPYGSGLERYNFICNSFEYLFGIRECKTLLEMLSYSQAYNGIWPTEFVGDSLRCNSYARDFVEVIQNAKKAYENRSRLTGKTWHSVHQAIYDCENLSLVVRFQEMNNCWFEFKP